MWFCQGKILSWSQNVTILDKEKQKLQINLHLGTHDYMYQINNVNIDLLH